MSTTLLELTDVQTYYGKIHALKGVSLHVDQGEIVTLIGSNGAGKSTTLRTISGLVRPRTGDVKLKGKSIVGVPAHQIVAEGLGHVPEGRGVFPGLTVLENLEMGAFLLNDHTEIEKRMVEVFQIFPRLQERIYQKGGTLSGGEQQMLAIGRALMSKPKLLLLDEPSLGLAPIIIQQIFDIIEQLRKDGVTVFLVEQNANQALKIADRAYVLENGRVVMQGTGEQLLTDPKVREAYLGG